VSCCIIGVADGHATSTNTKEQQEIRLTTAQKEKMQETRVQDVCWIDIAHVFAVQTDPLHDPSLARRSRMFGRKQSGYTTSVLFCRCGCIATIAQDAQVCHKYNCAINLREHIV
jgi:hypothetical protein